MVEMTPPNPYVGLRAFERQDRASFFGRDRETEEIVSLIYGHPLLLVYAQSGAGKTSLLNAGIAPTLEERGFQVLPLTRVYGALPERIDPREIENPYLLNALLKLEPKADPWELSSISLARYLQLRSSPADATPRPSPRVLVFDQFEELFAHYPVRQREHQDAFFRQVIEALGHDPLLRCVFVIREDHVAQLDPFARLWRATPPARFRLERLRRAEALAAITAPLWSTGRSFDSGVAERLVDELLELRIETGEQETTVIAGEFVEPVQLQVVCSSLWQGLPSEVHVITGAHLDAFGDVNRALMTFYERSMERVGGETGVSEDALRAWFDRALIRPAGTRGTVCRGPGETGGLPNAAVDLLENMHLIRADVRAGARWYELTHDRLVEPILNANERWRKARKTPFWKRVSSRRA